MLSPAPRAIVISDRLPSRKGQNGFSLIELLVTLGIISILTLIGLPAGVKAVTHAQLSQSLSNLKNIQQANQLYAGENDGKYVPIVAFDSKGIDTAWSANATFRGYLGISSTATYWPKRYLSPRATIKDTSGNVRIDRSYGINNQGINIPWGVNSAGTSYQARVQTMANPANAIAFADSLDWMINYSGVNNYTGMEVDLKSQGIQYTIAYRYNSKAAVVFYDGHAEAMTQQQLVSNPDLFTILK